MKQNVLRIRRNDAGNITDIIKRIREAGFKRIAVLGAQRAGTTIAARILAQELKLKYVDENDFDIHDEGHFREHLKDGDCVVQAPCMSHIADTLGDSVLVVFVWRDPKDVQASAARIDRVFDCRMESHNYGLLITQIADAGDMAKIRWNHWNRVQRPTVANYIELSYEAMARHKLFKPKSQRKDFEARQWE